MGTYTHEGLQASLHVPSRMDSSQHFQEMPMEVDHGAQQLIDGFRWSHQSLQYTYQPWQTVPLHISKYACVVRDAQSTFATACQ